MTFDDGPGTRLTPAILNILKKYNAKATFFLLGEHIQEHKEIVRQISEQGHQICSHGYEHLNYWRVSPFRALTDIKRGWNAIDTALETQKGIYPFRPPYGKLNVITLLYLWTRRVPIVFWTLVLGDTSPKNNLDSQATSLLIKNSNGGVLLAHDFDRSDDSIDSKIIECLSSALVTAKEENISTITISELLNKE